MELKDVLGGIAYRGAGCLFYSIDSDGDVWVLLGRRPVGHHFGSAYHWSIPEGTVKDDDPSLLDAAMRVAYEETGILDNRGRARLFWEVDEGGVGLSIYSLRLSSKVPPKRSRCYSDLRWFRLGDLIDDIDTLAGSQLKAFALSMGLKKAV